MLFQIPSFGPRKRFTGLFKARLSVALHLRTAFDLPAGFFAGTAARRHGILEAVGFRAYNPGGENLTMTIKAKPRPGRSVQGRGRDARLTILLPKDTMEALAQWARGDGRTASELVRRLIEEDVKAYGDRLAMTRR
jgi:hypothetical protein